MKRTSNKGAKISSSAGKTPKAPKLKVVFSQARIKKEVQRIAVQINRDYKGKTLYVVGILENCFIFMADLVRQLRIPVYCQFVKAEIKDQSSSGVSVRQIMYTPRIDATDKNILLVDGVMQSGVTHDHLLRYILGQMPTSFRIATLVKRTDEQKVEIETDYVGFQSRGKFLVGYGLGHEEQYRNLPYLARIQ
jgi:hypoxanthine phosphoribosyltransferase